MFNRAGMKAFRYRILISDDDSNTEYNETLNALYKMEWHTQRKRSMYEQLLKLKQKHQQWTDTVVADIEKL